MIDPTTCKHEAFTAGIQWGHGWVPWDNQRYVQLSVSCTQCGTPFQFVGAQAEALRGGMVLRVPMASTVRPRPKPKLRVVEPPGEVVVTSDDGIQRIYQANDVRVTVNGRELHGFDAAPYSSGPGPHPNFGCVMPEFTERCDACGNLDKVKGDSCCARCGAPS